MAARAWRTGDGLAHVRQLPLDAVRRRGAGSDARLELTTPAEELVLDYAADCPDKVRLLCMASRTRQARAACVRATRRFVCCCGS